MSSTQPTLRVKVNQAALLVLARGPSGCHLARDGWQSYVVQQVLDQVRDHDQIRQFRGDPAAGLPGGVAGAARSMQGWTSTQLTLDKVVLVPCFDALHLQEMVYGPDLAQDPRWPHWGPRVAEEIGVGSIVSYRLFTTKDTLGALNLYSRMTNAFDSDDLYNGQALAAHVAGAGFEPATSGL